MLTGPEFDRLSRVPVAQSFTDLGTGQSFVVAVNHLKSKGSCPDSGPDSDLRDGQACWNAARTRAARVMARWVRQLADEQAGGHALILGDLNAYRMEDPITALLDAGFKDLNASDGLKTEFSLIWSGQAGTLDYAFASPELRVFVQRAEVLNFNSPWDRSQDLPLPWLGASDHDPVLVDLRFRSAQ
jgi:predicted extracellular nuclease